MDLVQHDHPIGQLHDLQTDTPRPLFTFLGDEVVFGRLPLREPEEVWLRTALTALVEHTRRAGRRGRLAVERFDGEPITESSVLPILVEAGFIAGPRRAVLRV